MVLSMTPDMETVSSIPYDLRLIPLLLGQEVCSQDMKVFPVAFVVLRHFARFMNQLGR